MNNIFLNHLGFLCEAEKKVIIKEGTHSEFYIQDMSQVVRENLGDFENWKNVFTGKLVEHRSEMGNYLIGDFSSLKKPGVYRAILPEDQGHSWQFTISDGLFYPVIRLFLDFVHNWRSGNFSNEWRGPGHLDDGIRSDNGQYQDVSGGWYDAGDTRKWMTMSVLPIISFLDINEQLGLKWNHFANENVTGNDLLTEAVWGIKFILKMQDPETGMIFEEVGGGGEARKKPGMSWWYENHSGCLADNSQNHFTDNIVNSGDERTIRTTYNPIVQYTNLYILLRSAKALEKELPELAQECLSAAKRIWHYTKQKKDEDPLHSWTSVRAWRLMAGIELKKTEIINDKILSGIVKDLLQNFDEDSGFWCMDTSMNDPYRGVLHSAQPIIALGKLLGNFPELAENNNITSVLIKTWEQYLKPLSETNPFGIIPYGTYIEPQTDKDHYRKIRDVYFRFYMPDNSSQKINHGLGGHWTSWAHALALVGKLLNKKEMNNLAWDQIHWLLGNNQLDTTMVTGLGYNNPMPHSRFLGTFPGGFCVGPRGDINDEIFIDKNRRADWSSTEYWLTPLSNMLMALSILLPKKINPENKIGY